MTSGPALPCPKCRRKLEAHVWRSASAGQCWGCRRDFEFMGFPALTAAVAPAAPQPVMMAEESVCFFHAENRAEVICADCGRLLCGVCAINVGGKKACPSCVSAAGRSPAATAVRQRFTWDGAALSLALVPLVLWPFTFLTAPVALGFSLYGWNKPGSLVHGRRRWRLVLAGVIALVEIAAWVAIIWAAVARPRR